MEYALLNGTSYQLIKDFKHHESIRQSFNAMTEAHFGFSLEDWYQRGFWRDYYVPYALLHEDQVVSNVSVNKLEFVIANETRLGIQIGTVMTDEKYCHQGLNKYLLRSVLNDWKDQADFIYLFANDTVLDFYPKFGFERVQEYRYFKPVKSDFNPSLRKLNMGNRDDIALLLETVNQSIPISGISVRNHASMILFYGMSFMKNSFYYVRDRNAIVVADYDRDTLLLHDVFIKTPLDLNVLIEHISGKQIKRVELGFTPLDTSGFERSLIDGPDKLFMLKDQTDLFKRNYWMFPALSHA